MSQAPSGFERQALDLYQTPEWVAEAINEIVPVSGRIVWEPSVGPGRLAVALRALGATVIGSDVVDYGSSHQAGIFDFLAEGPAPEFARSIHGIITNPPYGKRNAAAVTYIERALTRIPSGGFVVLLLPADFDHAKTRRHLFGDCRHFAGCITLRRRIQWFEDGEHSNTQYHKLFIWQRIPIGQRLTPSIWYAPSGSEAA
ncbi:hypothetical protein [Prosthecomicrobium hirschii]|uniref:hypothetical protein n=1 Tax=Prosthecodimorpha hirschii TaxID=665126 RepID=UPI0022204267|nr:hypothetical protein [Prosthecomicrobium hirschii]MCW1844165.1 hypothetical protein [Prosthecomicrobium hirschii]